MKNSIRAFYVILACLASTNVFAAQSILALISSGSAESQAFSLILANEMQTDGKLVEVLLCGAAGDLALKNAPLPQTEAITPQGVSVKDLAQKLLKQGGKISVCAIYLPKRKLTDDALIEGVTVAKPKEMAAKVSDPNIRVFGN